MMAAEVAKDRSDDATHVTSEAEPTIKIDAPDAQNAPLDQSQVKGESATPATEEIENKHISDIANEVVTSAEVSVSGGSDNEAAKSKDDKPRSSSSTVKKPIAFKAINVNQKFLTTKATTPAAPAKVAEKPAATTTLSSTHGSLTARPRLIAKTGSGSVKSAIGANGKTGSAPDPNAVWNKNRPVPPPEPKKYTDEELKKYGIHMASRLQPEDTKGQANWADIDDDDEDWAPETITWKDGTQIAIPQTEEHTPAPPAPAPEPEPVPKPVEIVKESVAAEKPKSPAPGHASVIKPGVLGSGKGLILKGAAEKPTLVAKPPPPPAPVKSPWAPIPKVDKVSPMVVEPPPPSHHAPRYPPRDGGYPPRDGPTQYTGFPPPGPKEIAADDFSRGPWRDGPGGGGNRELYNSHSGRYEPVQERRGSMRPEPQYGRQPSVLQRPAHNDHHGPAEPSAAFQTHRTSDQHVPYGRRRASSNVSGVSSGFLNRAKGFEQPLHPPEILNARRESMTAGSDGPGSPRNFSPSGLQHGPRHPHPHNQGWPPRVSPAVGHAVPVPHHHAPDTVGVPPVGPPPVQEQVPLVTDQEIELQKRLMREKVEAARKRRMEEEEREKAAREERIRLKLQALGPAPESNSAKKAAAKEHPASTTEGAPQTGTTDEQKATEQAEVKTPTTTHPEKVEQQPNGVPPQILPDSEPLENRQPHGSNTQQPLWSSSAKQQGRYTATWGSQTSTKNVWGPPTNNRTLGNGTFNPDLGTSPPPVSNKPPGPIAPPSRNTMATKTNLFPDGAPARLPPIAPPNHSNAPAGPLSASERQAKANQWVSAARLNDEAFEAMLKDRFAEQDRRRAEKGLTVEDIQPAVKDVWRPTKLDENGMRVEAGPRQTVRVGKENPWVATQASQQAQPPAANTAMLANAGAAPRTSSRFFPSRQQTIAAAEYQRPHSPSPPPPDTETTGHPAFDGDVKHPLVCIPTPRPQVRLPPPSQAREEPKVQHPEAPKPRGPSFSWANTVAYQGEERAPASNPGSPWQARIDNLLGARKPSNSTQKPAPGVDSTSRAAYEHPEASVTVSLTAAMIAEASPTTKDMDEDCFEEQEMGSLPTVRIPTELPEMAWSPTHAPAPKPLHRKLFPLTTSAEPIRIDTSSNGIGSVIRIALPGTDRHPPFVTAVTIPFSRTRSNPRRGGGAPRGGRHPTASHNQRGMPGGRGSGRDASSPNDQGPPGPPTGPNGSHQQTRGRGGGYRGRDSAWSRSAPTAIQTS